MDAPPLRTSELAPGSNARPPGLWPKLKKSLAPLAALGVILGKFKALLIPAFKFLPVFLKTGGTMFLSVWVYANAWGWWFAAGFVVLIFVHECGHLVAARRMGLNVGAPVFIPFMGAFIALKEAPRNAWVESVVGIGGPLLGTAGAAACYLIYLATGQPIFRALAFTGYFLNLFNLAPVGFLDGGRIVTALSPWLWVLGYAIVIPLLITHFNFILLLIAVLGLPRVMSLFRRRTEEEARYFEVMPSQRALMAFFYFGLVGFLVLGMKLAHFTY